MKHIWSKLFNFTLSISSNQVGEEMVLLVLQSPLLGGPAWKLSIFNCLLQGSFSKDSLNKQQLAVAAIEGPSTLILFLSHAERSKWALTDSHDKGSPEELSPCSLTCWQNRTPGMWRLCCLLVLTVELLTAQQQRPKIILQLWKGLLSVSPTMLGWAVELCEQFRKHREGVVHLRQKYIHTHTHLYIDIEVPI